MPISYADLEEAFQFVSSAQPCEHEAYLCKETGKTYFVSVGAGMDETPDDIDDNSKYIAVPHKYDLDLGNQFVQDFAYARLNEEQADEVLRVFRQRGAYRRFGELLESWGKREEWHKFEQEATKAALLRWCEAEGIEIK